MRQLLAITCFLALFAGDLAAMVPPATLAHTAALFTAGRFLEAVEAGRHLGTPEALALAARARARHGQRAARGFPRHRPPCPRRPFPRPGEPGSPPPIGDRPWLPCPCRDRARCAFRRLCGGSETAPGSGHRTRIRNALGLGHTGGMARRDHLPRRADPWPFPLWSERKECGREFRARRSRGASEPDPPLRIRPRAYPAGPRGKRHPRPETTEACDGAFATGCLRTALLGPGLPFSNGDQSRRPADRRGRAPAMSSIIHSR